MYEGRKKGYCLSLWPLARDDLDATRTSREYETGEMEVKRKGNETRTLMKRENGQSVDQF